MRSIATNKPIAVGQNWPRVPINQKSNDAMNVEIIAGVNALKVSHLDFPERKVTTKRASIVNSPIGIPTVNSNQLIMVIKSKIAAGVA